MNHDAWLGDLYRPPSSLLAKGDIVVLGGGDEGDGLGGLVEIMELLTMLNLVT